MTTINLAQVLQDCLTCVDSDVVDRKLILLLARRGISICKCLVLRSVFPAIWQTPLVKNIQEKTNNIKSMIDLYLCICF